MSDAAGFVEPTAVPIPEAQASVRVEARSLSRVERLALGGSLAWIVAVALVYWPALWHDEIRSATTSDASVFALAGSMILHGATPYVTFWDHKPPLIYLLNALGLVIGGGHMWGIWLVGLAALLLGVWLCFVGVRRMWGPAPAVLATVYVAFSIPSLFVIDLPGGYGLPLQWATVLLLAGAVDWDVRPLRFGLALGVLTTLSFLIKPNQVGAGVAVALTLAVVCVAARRWTTLARGIGGVIVGSGAVLAMCVAYLAAQGALHAFVDAVFHYNKIYSTFVTEGERARAAITGLTLATKTGSAVLPAAGWLLAVRAVWVQRRSLATNAPMILAVLWLPIELALAAASGRPFPNYFATLYAPLAFASAVVALAIAELIARRDRLDATRLTAPYVIAPVGTAVGGLALGLAAWASANTVMTIRDDDDSPHRAALVDSTVAYIHTHTRPGEPIYVWGHAADIYLLSGHPSASRFIFPLPLLTPGYADSALVAGFMREIRAANPPLIIGVGVPGRGLEGEVLTPRLDVWSPAWRLPSTGAPDFSHGAAWWTMTPQLRAFYDYVAQNYVLAGYMGGRWPIYRRRSSQCVDIGECPDPGWHLPQSFDISGAATH